MTVTCVLQARMGSTRLPGKVLADVAGRPMLQFQIERILRDPLGELVVATSEASTDDPIEELCSRLRVPCVRGPEQDVLARFVRVVELFPCSSVVRLTGDCPLTDASLVHEAFAIRRETGADYVSNTLIRTFPDGLDVEVIATEALRTAATEANDPAEREHVTPYIYRRPERFSLRALRTDASLGDERWTVDTADDLAFVRSVVARLRDPRAGWRDVLSTVGRRHARTADALYLRPAIAADAPLILGLGDAGEAFRSGPASSRSDTQARSTWFTRRLNEPSGRVWVAEINGAPVASVDVAVRCGVGMLEIAIAPRAGDHTLVTTILGALDRMLAADLQVVRLVLELHRDDVDLRRAAADAEFSQVRERGRFVEYARDR